MKTVVIVGAGFSGLTLAYALFELGVPIEIVEKSPRVGGMLQTERRALGLVESAANAMLSNELVEDLLLDLKVNLATPQRASRRRFIFWRRPTRWPLTLFTTLKLIRLTVLKFLRFKFIRPHPYESVRSWARRNVDLQFEQRLLAPALQGIYAGDPARLSASLIFNKLFQSKKQRPGKIHGSVSPENGMAELMEKLRQFLVERGVSIRYQENFVAPAQPEGPVVICTSAWDAADILSPNHTEVARALEACESLPLITVTAFFAPSQNDLQGFGCLFPHSKGIAALGVLFNNCIFTSRSSQRSETWIFGGAKFPEVMQMSDDQVVALLYEGRKLLTQSSALALDLVVNRWPRALPHYTVEWERALENLTVPRPLFLHGNYLGALGLSQIYHRSRQLAAQLKDLYVS